MKTFLEQAVKQPSGQLGIVLCLDQMMDCKRAVAVIDLIVETIKDASRHGCIFMQLVSKENMEWFDGEKAEILDNSRGNKVVLLFSGLPKSL